MGIVFDNCFLRFYGLRQQSDKDHDDPCYCLSDFVAPGDGRQPTDFVGAFACTAGIGAKKLCEKYEKEQLDDYCSIMVSAFDPFLYCNLAYQNTLQSAIFTLNSCSI